MFKKIPAKALGIALALLGLTVMVSYIAGTWTSSGKLVKAAKTGDIKTVRAILDKHPDLVDQRDSHYKAPLVYWAALKGNADLCKLLIEYDADVNLADKYGMTALHKAAVFNHTGALEVLLARYADTAVKGMKYGKLKVTPLHLAAEAGNLDAAKILLEHNADVNGADSNVTPLHMAAGMGHYEVVELLLENGADVNARDWEERTPLVWALRTERDEVVELLRARGGII